jgi:hypothetical protein
MCEPLPPSELPLEGSFPVPRPAAAAGSLEKELAAKPTED